MTGARAVVDDCVPPRLRGVSHQYACLVFLALGIALVVSADSGRDRVAASVFAGTVVAMFGASALYHRCGWPEARRRWLRRLDHATIYGLIAGTYTPMGLLVLQGAWRVTVLAIVWTGAFVGTVLKLAWLDGPRWLPVVLAISLGWVGVVTFPQLLELGVAAISLLIAGGALYTAGAIVYALRRPDPVPAVFGYHELFHAAVIAAVACQYAAVAFWVLPHT